MKNTPHRYRGRQTLFFLRMTLAPSAAKPTKAPTAKRLKGRWWAEEDLNLRPHAYQACALTT